ncbi:Ish1 domain-containing protein [Nocardia wallacei]|uniref:Ish1 domain-containing protein n=1 Tax=Nocardia wallacei TaxID=480035 RepID=UPI002456D7BA|nr:Ish1 domain-containing protein [Nocardia wallacei]
MARLRTFVHVHGEDGPHVFGPDDNVPAWAVKAITNPGVWAEEPEAATSTEAPAGDPSESWTVAELKAYADEHGIDLGEATKKADILAAITESREQ